VRLAFLVLFLKENDFSDFPENGKKLVKTIS
jgi:hypothetical protein